MAFELTSVVRKKIIALYTQKFFRCTYNVHAQTIVFRHSDNARVREAPPPNGSFDVRLLSARTRPTENNGMPVNEPR